MKRLVCLSLCFLLLCACAAEGAPADARTVEVYYCTDPGELSAGSAVGKLTYPVDRTADLLHEALVRLAEEPEEKTGLHSSLTQGLHINTYSLNGRDIDIDLNEAYLTLDPVRRTLVNCCLVLTLCSLREVDTVSVYVDGRLQEQGLTKDILLPESAGDSEYQTELELWFPAADGSCLLSETRQLTIARDKPLAEYAAEELIRGPQRSDAAAALPEGTRLRSVHVKEGVCTLDLSEDFYAGRPETSGAERLTIFALVNTMTELPGVESVRFMAEGRRLDRYVYLSLRDPLPRAEEFTYPFLFRWGWYVVNLYLATADGKLTPVPVPADDEGYPDSDAMAARAVELLLSLEQTWGYGMPVPKGTRLLDMEVQDRICTLKLSREFLIGGEYRQMLAARALAATAIDAGGYSGVRIMADGAYVGSGALFGKEGDWIVD